MKMNAKIAQFSRDFRAILERICCISTFPLPPQTQRNPAVGLGHFVGHRGTMACEKGALFFSRGPEFFFPEFLQILLPSQLCENSCSRSKSFISATIFSRFLLPIQKFLYRPFAKVTDMPLIYTPLPNSMWFHHTSLRCVQRVHFGAYTWWKGPNSIKMGSKWANFICLCTPNGLGSLLEKCVFDPFSTNFWSPNGPFSRHIGIFHGPKRVTTCSKHAKNTCLTITNGAASIVEKHILDPFLTHFWSQNGPFTSHFGIFHGPKRVTTGSKRAKNTCLSITNGPRSLLEKHLCDPFLTHFWSQNGPFSRHFRIFHGPKRATTGSKRAKNTCLSIPSGRGTTLEKMIFFAPGMLVHPPLAPAVRAPSCPPAPPSEH